jgi:hypothetical protein
MKALVNVVWILFVQVVAAASQALADAKGTGVGTWLTKPPSLVPTIMSRIYSGVVDQATAGVLRNASAASVEASFISCVSLFSAGGSTIR